jgi:hypothetical protein
VVLVSPLQTDHPPETTSGSKWVPASLAKYPFLKEHMLEARLTYTGLRRLTACDSAALCRPFVRMSVRVR